MTTIFPRPLRQGDKIAILSPASIIDPALVDGAAKAISALGWEPIVMPHTTGHHGSYSGSADNRLTDMEAALTDPEVRAILCSRGGYGAVHLLDKLDRIIDRNDPKWLIGFSDISALHALWHRHGIASVHASMARHLALFPADDAANSAVIGLLRDGTIPSLRWNSDSRNRTGSATGRIKGGNLAVLAGLIGTPYDMLRPGDILFIEDIAEPIYKVERILYQLKLSGVLANLRGLVTGAFTQYTPDANYRTMEDMIAEMTAPYGYPVAMHAPIGHIDQNMPVVQSAEMTLTVTDSGASLTTAI
ncbi:MAG: LD-carboxypeptidase [Muribaculaceae bacterium]|nr:LD-carboxypeptidase [Muribaculaceae bacterium]